MEYAIKNNGQYESITFHTNILQTVGKTTITLQARLDSNDFSNYQSIAACNTVTSVNLPIIAELKLVSKKPFSYDLPFMIPRYQNKRKIEDYLYEITYGNIDYDYAYEHFKPSFGGCSAVRNGNYLGRNFDWLYNNQVQFVVHTPDSLEHFGVLGVSGIIPGVEQDNVDQDSIIIEGVDMFKLIPFYLLDGINSKKVFCTHNVVPLDNTESPTIEITAKKEEKDKVCIPMLVRFILDKFETAEQAISYLRDYTTLYFTEEMIQAGYQSHFILGDCNSTYIIEFINGEMQVIKGNYITNFCINNVQFNKNHTIIYPTPTLSGINEYGMGLERWDIISNDFYKSGSFEGMKNLLEKLKYSNTYGDPFWYSELVKMTDDNGNKITVDTLPEDCDNAKQNMLYLYRTKDRDDPKVWITCHSSIYSIKEKTLNISNQEGDQSFEFILC